MIKKMNVHYRQPLSGEKPTMAYSPNMQFDTVSRILSLVNNVIMRQVTFLYPPNLPSDCFTKFLNCTYHESHDFEKAVRTGTRVAVEVKPYILDRLEVEFTFFRNKTVIYKMTFTVNAAGKAHGPQSMSFGELNQ